MKILHTADIHLGMKNYGRVDAETGLNSRLLDFRRSFDVMVERALDEDVDVFLFCGDAYRTADPTPTQQKMFAECLRPVAQAGIPIVMVIGNHDHPVTFGKASALDIFGYVSGTVHLFRRPALEVIDTKSGPLQLVALPWPIRSVILSKEEHRKMKPHELRDFIEEFYVNYVNGAAERIMARETTDAGRRLDPGAATVLAGHLTVQGAELAGSERTSLIAHEPKFTAGQLAVAPIDYVALGHIHHHQNRGVSGGPPVVYCGSIERVSFKEWDETKGFVLVEINADGEEKATTFTHVETPARPFVALKIDARDAAEPTEQILREIEKKDLAGAIARVRYHIDEAQVPLIDVRRLRAALAEAHTIAAIERTVDPAERKQRTVVTRDSTLEEALRRYVAQHEDLASIEDDLVEAALDLEHIYDAQRRDEA